MISIEAPSMEPLSPIRKPVSGRRLVACGCFGSLLLAIVLWFLWWALLTKVWADCNAGNSMQEGAVIIILSPLVILSALFAFAIPTAIFGRRSPRTAATVGLTLAICLTYLWFAFAVPQASTVSFSGPRASTCAGGMPPWWPFWLPI